VVLRGSGFTGATAVNFGSTAATDFTVLSDSAISAVAPLGTSFVSVTVTTPSGTSNGAEYVYTHVSGPAPAVTAVSPNSDSTAGGQVVTVTGSNFLGTSRVSFGSMPATSFTVLSATQLTATAPAGSAGTVDVRVTNPDGTSATGSADRFTYLSTPAPTVTGLGTGSGGTGGGTSVIITGTNFSSVTAVNFGGVAASYMVNSSTQITATSPAGAAGTVDVTVSTASGTSATGSADRFTYTAAAAPTVTGLSTTSGGSGGGTSVTITGTNLGGTTAVSFGGVPASSSTVNSDTSVTATAPAQAAGVVDVTVQTYSGTSALGSADRFSYTATLPAVTGLGTSSGSAAGGYSVTVNGSGLSGATGVFFGGVAATSFSVSSDGSLTAVVPAGAVGTVDVTVTAPGGSSATSSSDQFTYTAASAPTVTGVSPNTGTTAGGGTVTITGTHFTGATAVNFGTVAAAGFTVNSDTSITATAPPEAAGTVDVTVTTAGGTSATSSADHFTVTATSAPVVSGVTGSSGDAAGGEVVTVTGSGFTGATAVSFGTTPATDFTCCPTTP
jgi:hypothetical protein